MTPERIKEIRTAAKLSQTELAAVLRVAGRKTVQRWETGEISLAGPAEIVLELLAAGKLPKAYREKPRAT